MVLRHAALKQQEDNLRGQVRQLTDAQRKQYYQLEVDQVKDPDTFAVLNWFFVAGLHHFYLGKFVRGGVNLSLFLLSILLLVIYPNHWVGYSVLIGILVIELPQLLNSQNIVHHHNNQIMTKCLAKVLQTKT
ncbi:hypothetical protein L4D00_15100 [Photobacterium swingsii]|uniref:TM2 domain-containing protein n=1 Tax=Photobacterium swingsii TaxID=680026 RepID=A0A0J8VCE9_9GAMM|nr:hypothetical protein [Photobacterium swingsii]KMV30991.1 membrane protein [Photobacterium swingsii]PSW23474.1 hypothetical protein C9I94_15220 [Photobacterium swingsii]